MLRRLYDRTMALAAGPNAEPTLAAVAFAESSFFPIPPDLLLIPMALANRAKAWRYAAIATVASVVGGLLGYIIGAALFDTVGQWLIRLYGYGDKVAEFQAAYNEWGAWIILIKGTTPIPYKIVTIASGFARYDLLWFVILSLITRGIRFFLVAGLLYRFGEPVREFVERRLTLVTTLFVIALVGGFVVLRYVI
jgi:membrane protein YqaA with SNARE-associated domain